MDGRPLTSRANGLRATLAKDQGLTASQVHKSTDSQAHGLTGLRALVPQPHGQTGSRTHGPTGWRAPGPWADRLKVLRAHGPAGPQDQRLTGQWVARCRSKGSTAPGPTCSWVQGLLSSGPTDWQGLRAQLLAHGLPASRPTRARAHGLRAHWLWTHDPTYGGMIITECLRSALKIA